MTSARRPTAYRPRRDTREVVVAVLAVLGVLAVTVILLFVLQPSEDEPPTEQRIESPPPSVAVTKLPGDPSASTAPPASTPETSAGSPSSLPVG